MNADIESLTIAYGDEAYAFANINPIFNQDDQQRKISIKYNIIYQFNQSNTSKVCLFKRIKASPTNVNKISIS